MVLKAVSTVYQLSYGGQCTYMYPCFPGVLLISHPHNILSKPLAAFPHNPRRSNGKWLSCNDYHQSSERVLAEPGSNLLFSSPQSYRLSYGVRQSNIETLNFLLKTIEQLSTFTITQAEVIKVLKELKSSKAEGPDQTHSKLHIECKDVLATPLSTLINKSNRISAVP